MRTLHWMLALMVFVAPFFARAEFQVPELTGPVVDQAHILDRGTEQKIEAALRYLHEQGGSQITVLTVPSLEGLPIEQASIKVTDAWKLGTAKGDNGVLLLVAPKERSVRIEVGQGLEGVLTDADSKEIVSDSIIPLFRAGDFPSGVLVGVYQIARKTDPNVDLTPYLEGAVQKAPRGGHSPLRGWVLFIFFILFILFSLLGGGGGGRRRFRRGGFYYGGGGWGGGGGFGGSGGGGWSGGGGGFSGGGASGNW